MVQVGWKDWVNLSERVRHCYLRRGPKELLLKGEVERGASPFYDPRRLSRARSQSARRPASARASPTLCGGCHCRCDGRSQNDEVALRCHRVT